MKKTYFIISVLLLCFSTMEIQAQLTVTSDSIISGCPGDTLVMQASASGGLAPYTFNWSPFINVLDTAADTTMVIVDNTSIIYTVKVTDANGDTASSMVSLDSKWWTFTVGADKSLNCGQNSGTVFASPTGGSISGNLSYLWSNGSTDFFQSGLSPGYYTVTGTNSFGCTFVDDLLISWKSTGQQIALDVPSLICKDSLATFENNSIFITDIGGNSISWTWDFGDGTPPLNNNDTLQSHSYASAGSYDVTLSMVVAGSCMLELVQSVVVVDCGSIGDCSVDSSITENGFHPDQSLLQCVERGIEYNETIQLYNFDSVEISPGTFATVNSLRITQINNLPCGLGWQSNKIDNTFLNSERGCISIFGSTLDASGQYELDIRLAINLQVGPITIMIPDTGAADIGYAYSLRVINPGIVCPQLDTVPPVNSMLACNGGDTSLVVTTDQYTVVCPGDSFQINTNVLTGTGPFNYAWSPTASLSCTDCPNPKALVSDSIVYSVTVTDAFLNSGEGLITITLSEIQVDAGMDTVLTCGENMSDATAIASGDLIEPVSYLWSTGDTTINVVLPGGTHTVTVTNGLGCEAVDDIKVAISPAFTVDIGDNEVFCDTNERMILLDPTILTQGTGLYTYDWQPASLVDNNTVFTPTATVNQTTTFVVVIDDLGNGCQFIDSITFTFDAFSISAGTDTSILDTAQTVLDAAIVVGSSGFYTFHWSPATGLSDTTVLNPIASPDTTTLYFLSVTDTVNGCFATDSVLVTVDTVADTVVIDGIINVNQFDDNKVKIYPNPGLGLVYIEFVEKISDNMTITLTDLNGKVIELIRKDNSSSRILADLHYLSKGIYFVKIESKTYSLIKKIVIQ